jgi:hypothetical protein
MNIISCDCPICNEKNCKVCLTPQFCECNCGTCSDARCGLDEELMESEPNEIEVQLNKIFLENLNDIEKDGK